MMKISPHIALFLMLAAATAFVGACNEGAITNPGQIIFPESGVSFGRQVLPLFELGCNQSGCHNEIDQAGGVSLASYFDLFRRPGLVLPGDSAGSVLGQIAGERLPHLEVPISLIINQNQRHGIQVWIQEGASNN